MTVNPRRRALLAALLALVYPGLGHAYLRAWGRAILWFVAVIATAVLLVPVDIFTGISGLGDVPAAYEAIPIEATMGILLVALFNVIDAYWTGKRMSIAHDDLRCPSCGRPVDEDLSFCHWCTAEFTVESA